VFTQLSNFPFERAFSIQPLAESVEFSSEEVARITALTSSNLLRPGNLSEGEVNSDIRISNIKFYYPDESTYWIFEKINNIVEVVNEHVFNFDLNGYSSFQYAEYRADEGGKYDFHSDIDYTGRNAADPQTRKLSLSIILNEQGVDYEGGDFQILIGATPTTCKQSKGGVLIFPSWVMHRVTPVTRGVRKSLVVWVTGPKFR